MKYEIKDVFFSGNRRRLEENIDEFSKRAYTLQFAADLLNNTPYNNHNDIAFAIIIGDAATTPEDLFSSAIGFKQAFEAQYEVRLEIEKPKTYFLQQQQNSENKYTPLETTWYEAINPRREELKQRVDGVIGGILHPFKSESEREGFDNTLLLLAYIASLEKIIMPSDNKLSDFEKLKKLYRMMLERAYPYILQRLEEHYKGKYGNELQESDENRLIKMLRYITFTGSHRLEESKIEIPEIEKNHYNMQKERLLSLIETNAAVLRQYSKALDKFTLAKSEKLMTIKQKGEWRKYQKAKKEELNLSMQQENPNHTLIRILPT